MATRASKLARAEIQTVFERFRAANPHPKSDLEYGSAYQLLVAVVLSAQATDKGVNVATRKLFRIAPTPEAMVSTGVDGVEDLIRTIGLFRAKAKNVVALSHLLLERHGGEVPRNRAALEALPGVGRKTANVVLNIVFHEPTMAVDTHIFRIANRIGLAPGKDVLAVENGLLKVVPAEFMLHAHHWLILHGRYTCTARKPLCGQCSIADICRFRDKNIAE
ncbi:MAG: endonuclease III [Methyloversatilis sp.]|jgi:endonuclease-3|nr:endonuclease III [Methyloversatilis sp.]MBP6194809.1 endonuclease III [Methyloversatilis sp.]MBP9118264.1 endonuclease III [Methyloversatilis sp.]